MSGADADDLKTSWLALPAANNGPASDANTTLTNWAAVPGNVKSPTPRTTFAAVGNADGPLAASDGNQPRHAIGDEVSLPRLRVRIEGFLGAGGEAEVYRVALLLHEPVRSRMLTGSAVLKLYKAHCQLDVAVRDTWRTLSQSVVIQLLDDHVVAGGTENWELLAIADGGALVSGSSWEPCRDRVQLHQMVGQMAAAIAGLHAGGIVHRDISPDNFLWRDAARTQVVLSDLGLARVVAQGSVRTTHAGGKKGYMAPEGVQLAFDVGDGHGLDLRVTARLDWYALGVSISALWWGGHPQVVAPATYSSEELAEFRRARRVPLAPDLPEDFRILCECLTAYDPGQRAGYPDIQRWLRGEQLLAPATDAQEDPYPALTVRLSGESARILKSPRDLARVYRGNRTAGAKHFFLTNWKNSAWAARDGELMAALDAIKTGERAAQPSAAFEQAVYLLDSSLPFQDPVTAEVCHTPVALVDWLEAVPARVSELSLVTHPLWAFFEARLWHETGMLDLAGGRRTLEERPEALTGDLQVIKCVLDLRERGYSKEREALALMRRQLQSWAFRGRCRGPDGHIHEDIDGCSAHVQAMDVSTAYLAACRDESDAFGVWLVERDPTMAGRLSVLRSLSDEEFLSSPPWTWFTALLGRLWDDDATPIALDGPARTVDVWQHPLWQAASAEDALTAFEPFLRLEADRSATLAARDWLMSEPSSGPQSAIVGLLLTTRWASLVAARQGIELGVAALVRGIGRSSFAGESSELLDHVAMQLRNEIAAASAASSIRVSPEYARVEAVTALGVCLSTRALATLDSPKEREQWRALFESLAPEIREAFVAACTKHARHPDVLSHLLAWRAAIRDSLAPLQLSLRERWAEEDAQLSALASALSAEERLVAHGSVQSIIRKSQDFCKASYEDHFARIIGGSDPSSSFWMKFAWCLLGGLAFLAWRVASPTVPSQDTFFGGLWDAIRNTFWALTFMLAAVLSTFLVDGEKNDRVTEGTVWMTALVALIFTWWRQEVIAGTTWLWTVLMFTIVGCGALALTAVRRFIRGATVQCKGSVLAASDSLIESAATPTLLVWTRAREMAGERWLCCAAAVVTSVVPSDVTTAAAPVQTGTPPSGSGGPAGGFSAPSGKLTRGTHVPAVKGTS